MKKMIITAVLASLSCTPVIAAEQQSKKVEKYERVSPSEFKIAFKLPAGAVVKMKNGVANGGPIKELSAWGKNIALANNMIKDGFIHTKDYGKFEVVANDNGGFRIELTPTQQKRLLEIKKSQGPSK